MLTVRTPLLGLAAVVPYNAKVTEYMKVRRSRPQLSQISGQDGTG